MEQNILNIQAGLEMPRYTRKIVGGQSFKNINRALTLINVPKI
jgi:hypothetical protein